MVRNVAAGSLSGALAAWASNPIDLLKTRLQSKENPHKTSAAVVRHIIKEDGVRGLWRGTVPSTVCLFSPLPPSTPTFTSLCILHKPTPKVLLFGHPFSLALHALSRVTMAIKHWL